MSPELAPSTNNLASNINPLSSSYPSRATHSTEHSIPDRSPMDSNVAAADHRHGGSTDMRTAAPDDNLLNFLNFAAEEKAALKDDLETLKLSGFF